MKRTAVLGTLSLIGVVALLAAVTIPAFAQQGQNRAGQRSQRGVMGDAMYLERTWTAVSFQLECTQEQINQLRPTYAAALQARTSAMQQAMENRDFEAYGQAIADCKSTLDAKLQQVLTEQQWTKLQTMMTPLRRTRGQQDGRGGPGGGQQ